MIFFAQLTIKGSGVTKNVITMLIIVIPECSCRGSRKMPGSKMHSGFPTKDLGNDGMREGLSDSFCATLGSYNARQTITSTAGRRALSRTPDSYNWYLTSKLLL